MKNDPNSRQRLVAKPKKLHCPGYEPADSETAGISPEHSDEDLQQLVHALKVHQIELEMQNEELQRIQAELAVSRDKYAELYDFAPIGYFTFDAQGLILEVNPSGAKLLRKSREQLTDKPFAHYIADAAGRTIFSRHRKSVLQEQGMQRCEISLKGKDGNFIHGQLQSVRVNKSKSQDDFILSSIVDDTHGNHLAGEIQGALEYAENIVETLREPMVVLNSELKILTANHSLYETFKVTSEKNIDHFIYDVGNRQWDIPRLRVLIEEILPQDRVINGYEVEHDFPDIDHKTILLNARQIFREEIGSHIILLAMEDITERKRAEERISEVNRQQQAILDNIPNIAWLQDRQGCYVAVNAPFIKAFGVAPQDLFGKDDFDIVAHELAVKYVKDFRPVIKTGKRTSCAETHLDLAGTVQHVEKVKTPIFNAAGRMIGIIGIVYDVTNSKEIEVSLRYDSTQDVLTGLYNRAFFDEVLERLAAGRKFLLSIVMTDVNGLKTINDTQGHGAGDKLICTAARIILEGFRTDDIVARIGGDEFAILLPATDSRVAEETVARIRRSPELSRDQVGIAFGIACAENNDQLANALKLSDARMYQDKTNQKKIRPEV